jgi:hypothetical protein
MTLQVYDEMSRQVKEIEAIQKMIPLLMKTSHYAKLGPDGIAAVVAKARSLNMDCIEALNGALYYLNGRVGMSTETMAALIRQKGHSIMKDPKSDNTVCILHGKRADNGDTWTVSFSMEDAKRAQLIKHSYEKYPSGMLYNRAMAFLARQLFPDVIRGAGYTMEELKEIPPVEEIQEMKVEIISQQQADELNEIFSLCDTSYKAKVLDALKKTSACVEKIEDIPLHLFERIKIAALKKAEENRPEEVAV